MATSGPAPAVVSHLRERRGVDLAFGLVTAVSLVVWYRASEPSWFWIDEWPMAHQVTSWTGIFEPYNQHLSITILGTYHVLLSVFGFTTHVPFRVVALLSFAAVAVAFYRTTRSLLGALPAAIGGVVLLWPALISIETAALNHWLTLTGAVLCAHGLRGEGRRRDGFVYGGLVLALTSSGGGVAAVVAAVVHSACTRAGRSRWFAVAVPTAAWLVWLMAAEPFAQTLVGEERPGLFELVSLTATLLAGSFSSLALANDVGGWIVLGLFVAVVYRRLYQGVAASAEALAWTAALGAWWFGLAWNRSFYANEDIFRYKQVSAVLILLAVTPRVPVDWSPLTRRLEASWPGRHVGARARPLIGPVIVVLVALGLGIAVADDLAESSDFQIAAGRNAQRTSGAVSIPGAVPPETVLTLNMGYLRAGDVVDLFDRFQPPSWAADPDAVVARSAELTVRDDVTGIPGPACRPIDQPHLIGPGSLIVVRAGEFPAQVLVRRWDSNWVPIGTVPAERSAWLLLPGLHSPIGWEVRSADGCTDSLP